MSAKKGRIKSNKPKSRKQLRKEERKNKKTRRNEYYTNRRKPGQFVLLKKTNTEEETVKKSNLPSSNKKEKAVHVKTKLAAEELREKEKKQQMKLQKQMNKQRSKQLLQANLEEDRNIKHLEKQLKLNKRKSKSVPASFASDGLDYLLEVCDPENLKSSALTEQQLVEVNNEFEEDLQLMTRNNKSRSTKNMGKKNKDALSSSENYDFGQDEDDEIEEKIKSRKILNKNEGSKSKRSRKDSFDSDVSDDSNMGDDFSDDIEDEDDEMEERIKSRKTLNESEKSKSKKSRKDYVDFDVSDDSNIGDDVSDEIKDQDENSEDMSDDQDENASNVEDSDDSDANNASGDESSQKRKSDGTWEDIYGRLRTKDGSIINEQSGKYIPPAARLKTEVSSTDKVRSQKLEKLKKQLKGLINRLAESNMHSIATQIEELYMNNSRNDMNSTITNLVTEALISNILAPERLLMEHILLIIILHSNVGTEVGAHFLQTIVKQFDDNLQTSNVENKQLDNVVIILAQLYNFKLFDCKLIYEIIDKLSEKFEEKNVECILHILRSVGFSLRKDNPVALKNLILNLQKKASEASDAMKDNSRVKFMLDILLAIKNNNVTKIPNYDTTYSEHLKKIMKGFIRKGNYVTQLNISLEDLVKADEKGKWWVVGSAWTGHSETINVKNTPENISSFSRKLLDLAAKQRMNTDTRRNIFCIIMSAEDYLDAFEKLLRLSLKNQQDREIIHVILHCCLQEKTYNPYYATLAQKFCEYDRKYQMTIKYSIWDKLKALKDHSSVQISHLAKLLIYLFVEKGLSISTLKIVQFSELDKVTLRFIRQILLGILLHEDLEVCKGVFEKVGQSDKLKMFRESLRLFLHHFLLKNLDSQGIEDDKKMLLQQRVKVVERLLTGKEKKFLY